MRITGCGFSALNTVTFGPVTVNQVPSMENGTLITFMIPKEVRTTAEAPPMPLAPGSYQLLVSNTRGRSNAFNFVLR